MLLHRAACLACLCWAAGAWAYRPFDGTDADTAEFGELEIELGPVGYWHAGDDHVMTVPTLVVNFGFAPRWELVLEGRNEVTLAGAVIDRVSDTGLFAKGVLRKGTLQGETGLSLATELGVLLPTFHDEPGLGVSAALIASYSWDAITLHVNLRPELTRTRFDDGGAHHFELFASVIAEGPRSWRVRPVAELYVDDELRGPLRASALAGVLIPAGEHVVFDAAVRLALADGLQTVEARAGLTWAYSFFGEEAKPEQEHD